MAQCGPYALRDARFAGTRQTWDPLWPTSVSRSRFNVFDHILATFVPRDPSNSISATIPINASILSAAVPGLGGLFDVLARSLTGMLLSAPIYALSYVPALRIEGGVVLQSTGIPSILPVGRNGNLPSSISLPVRIVFRVSSSCGIRGITLPSECTMREAHRKAGGGPLAVRKEHKKTWAEKQ
ncbi:hypothetical protein IFM5058_08887 [Aspergillus udagawae]|nr:hypothetical protein IFM5058_08887 [Aspergillus udagawae]